LLLFALHLFSCFCLLYCWFSLLCIFLTRHR
jgi:hypothetical protein